jgi:hypothetical protein
VAPDMEWVRIDHASLRGSGEARSGGTLLAIVDLLQDGIWEWTIWHSSRREGCWRRGMSRTMASAKEAVAAAALEFDAP